MVIGGFDETFTVLDSAEIYDPRTNTWSLIAAHMHDARVEDFVAVLLPGRKVLVAGGFAAGFSSLKSAEILRENRHVVYDKSHEYWPWRVRERQAP